MKRQLFPVIFAIFVGVGMIGFWVFAVLSNQVPELETIPREIIMHIIAEVLTAVMLIISAVLLIKNKNQKALFNISFGMLIYTAIASSGYYLQKNDVPMVIMFSVVFVLSVVSVCMVNKRVE